MTASATTKSIRDGAATLFTAREWDESGSGAGPFSSMPVLGDGAGGSIVSTSGALIRNTVLTNFGAGEYETVAASATAQALGATGAAGDYLSGILVIPATTSPGAVTLYDGSSSPDVGITLFVGGATSVSNLVPFFVPLGMISVNGAWKVTTGTSVSCIGIGNFT